MAEQTPYFIRSNYNFFPSLYLLVTEAREAAYRPMITWLLT